VRDSAGEVTHFIGIQSDVTARREAEEGLRQSKEAIEHDLKMAAEVQRSLLPPPELRVGGLRIAHSFHPCDDLAGDGVGVVSLPDGRTGLYLLDVSGHGVRAALLSFTLNHLLTPRAEGALVTERGGGGLNAVSPERVAERLNRQFPMGRSRQYFTIVYGTIDPSSGRFDYAIAGHLPPVLVPKGGPPAAIEGSGLPIGMIHDAKYASRSLTLEPGDRLFFYTDGVVEATNSDDEEFGTDRLLAALARQREHPLRDAAELVAAEVRAWRGGRLEDDVSLLAVERVD